MIIYYSTPTHHEKWSLEIFRKRHTLATRSRKAFVGDRPALVGRNIYGEYLAQFDEPPQNLGWSLVHGPVDFVEETIEGESACEFSSAAVAITEIDEK